MLSLPAHENRMPFLSSGVLTCFGEFDSVQCLNVPRFAELTLKCFITFDVSKLNCFLNCIFY